MNKFYSLAVLALAPLAASHAMAGNQAASGNAALEEVVVVSSRVPMPLRRVGTSVSVITAEEISQLGYNALYDALRTQPGVGVSSQGSPGSVTSLRIRGEENYRTRFFLDGIDISDTSSPQTTARIEQILSAGIQRVEILRGPQGLMYGADAGGVVAIETLAPREGLSGQVSAESGRYDSRQYAGNVNGGNGTVDFSLSGADYDSGLFNATTTDTDLRDDDGYGNTTLHGRFGWNVTEQLRLSLAARDVDSRNEYDGCFTVDTFAPTNDCSDDFDQQSWRAAADLATGDFSHELFYTNTATDRDFFSEGEFAFKLDGELERSGYIGSFDTAREVKLVFGAELLTESIDDGALETDRDQTGYFGEIQGGLDDRLFLTAGARLDDNEDFGSHTSYRVSGAWLVPVDGGEVKFRATWGTGFRAPSLFEIATNENPFTGPPAQGFELSEEQSEGYDLAVSWAGESGDYLEAVYFDQTISDEIFYDFDSFGYLQKTGDTESKGVELAGEWVVTDSLRIGGNYTYTDSQDINGDPRARRPDHMANTGLSWSALSQRLVLGLNARFAGDAVDFDGTELDGYEVLDVNASYVLWRGLSLYGRVENLTDEDYQEVATYNTSGIAAYIGARYTF